MSKTSARCAELASVDYGNFVISLIILLGIFLSYVPQHIRIVLRRSSEGLSPWFVLLGTTSGSSALGNILSLPKSRADLACCDQNSGLACFAGSLGVLQIAAQWMGFMIIMLLFLIFFPRATPLAPPETLGSRPTYRTALLVGACCIAHLFAVLIVHLVVVYKYPSHLQAVADVLGVVATVLASVQYFPQIYTTFRLGTVASLSIPMMCLQTPGGYVWATSLAVRLGADGWSIWSLYYVTATLQGVLLVMSVVFELRIHRASKARKAAAEGNEGGDGEGGGQGEGGGANGSITAAGGQSDERTPLLGNGGRDEGRASSDGDRAG